jgi:peptide/nickel transport system substrate-binding protein
VNARTSGVVLRTLLVFVIAASLALSASAQAAAPRRGGTIVVLIGGDPPLLNPHFSTLPWVSMISMAIYNTLVVLDPTMKAHPGLAETWTVSADLKTYRFKLVQGVRWHDGRPLTSADVKFTFEQVASKLNPNGPIAFRGLERVEAPDPATVIVQFTQPHPAFLLYLGWPITGAILPRHVYEGTEIRQNPANVRPIGSGAFRFVEWNRGSTIALERNPNYFRQQMPYLDRVVFRVVRDAASRVIALENKEVDFILGFDLPLRDSVQVRRSRDLKAVFNMDRAISGQLFIGLNTSRPPFSDVRVRRAIAHAIDKNVIWQRVFFGLGAIAVSPISRYIGPQHNRGVTKFEYSTQRANQLLDEAALARGAGGSRLRVRLAVDGSSAEFTRIADIVREQLADVGIELTIETFDFNTWFDRVYVRRDYEMSTGRRLTGPDAIFAMNREFHSSNTQPAQRNFYLYRNPEVDRAIEEGLVETDATRRLQGAHRLQELIARDVPNVFLMDTPQPNAYRSVFQGLDNGPWGAVRLEEVWVNSP